MSQKKFVAYKSVGFWVHDVALGIFLKQLIDVATNRSLNEDTAWLTKLIEEWRVIAVVSDYGLNFDDRWSSGQIEVICGLLMEACRSLANRGDVSADEMVTWDILDGIGIAARGEKPFPTAPVIELGLAILALLDDSLPPAPVDACWLYGTMTGRLTIEQRNPLDSVKLPTVTSTAELLSESDSFAAET